MAQFVKGNVGTTQITDHDLSDARTDLFKKVQYKDDYVEAKIVTFRALDRGGGEKGFDITTNNQEYLDLSEAFVTYHFRLKNPAGETCKYEEMSFVPDIGNGIWKRGIVRIGERELLGLQMNDVGYTEYFKAMINSSHNTYANKLFPRLFLKDKPQFYTKEWKKYGLTYTRNAKKSFDMTGSTITGFADGRSEDDKKLPFWIRHQMATDMDTFQVCTPLPSHLMGLSQVLPTNLHVEFVFQPQKKAFYFLSKDENLKADDYEIEIVDMFLTVNILTCSPDIVARHNRRFLTHRTTIQFQAIDVVVGTANQGVSTFRFQPWSGQCPQQVLIACVDQAAFNGDLKECPYNFENLDAECTYLQIGQKTIPHTLIETNFKKRLIHQQYMFNLINLSQFTGDHASLLDLDAYLSESTINAYYVTPNGKGTFDLFRNMQGNLEVVYKLRTALTKPKRIICMGIFNRMLRIDKNRNAEAFDL